jgi:elongator complex protein 1
MSSKSSPVILVQTLTIPSRRPANHEKLNSTCDALRAELESRGMVRYVDTILTTHVCKSPPDLEAGLRVLLQLKGESST